MIEEKANSLLEHAKYLEKKNNATQSDHRLFIATDSTAIILHMLKWFILISGYYLIHWIIPITPIN